MFTEIFDGTQSCRTILTPPSAFSPKNRTENNNRSQPFFVMNFYDFGLGSCWCSKVCFPRAKMSGYLPRSVRPPAMTLSQLKDLARGMLQFDDPLLRKGYANCFELCGQSPSFRDGFKQRGMVCVSFDCRILVASILIGFSFGNWTQRSQEGGWLRNPRIVPINCHI